MRRFIIHAVALLTLCVTLNEVQGQNADLFRRPAGSGNWAQNLRITSQSADHLETWLVMDESYDGSAGATALLDAVILKKGEKESSKWFTCKRQVVGMGSGTVTLKVRFHPGKDGAPASITTDRLQIRFLNSSGRTILTSVPFSRTIHWGEKSGRINERVNTKPKEQQK